MEMLDIILAIAVVIVWLTTIWWYEQKLFAAETHILELSNLGVDPPFNLREFVPYEGSPLRFTAAELEPWN
jgi:hypothetical protein